MKIPFHAIAIGQLTLHYISPASLSEVLARFQALEEYGLFAEEVLKNYVPHYDTKGVLDRYGFYITLEGELAGVTLLGIHNWLDLRGYTTSHINKQMRGRGIAPASKAHLFYLGFSVLGLNRIEISCLTSNISSQRSIGKTRGVAFEATFRQRGLNDRNEVADEFHYAILKRDWLTLYETKDITLIS
jgi:ribosomal-protein-serine acetyltransferase